MSAPLLATKLYIPPLRASLVPPLHLIERLNAALPTRRGFPRTRGAVPRARDAFSRTRGAFPRALPLISVTAGFGQMTLVKVIRSGAEGQDRTNVNAEG